MLASFNKYLAAALAVAAGAFLVFIMMVTVTDVVARAINPGWRIFGVFDMVEFSLAWMIYISIALAFLVRAQIVVDLLDTLSSVPLAIALRVLASALALAAVVLTGLQTITPAFDALDWGERTLDLGIQKFWYWTAIWFGLAASAVTILLAFPGDIGEARGQK